MFTSYTLSRYIIFNCGTSTIELKVHMKAVLIVPKVPAIRAVVFSCET